MSFKEKIVHRLTRSAYVRSAYQRVHSLPLIGPAFRKAAAFLVPRGRLWIRIPAGIGKGLWMLADPRSELGYSNGDHEQWFQDLLLAELRPGDCYYDIGAHSGFFSLIAARIVGPAGAVVAVEPAPENAQALRANIEKNGLRQVSVVEAALWSEAGVVEFNFPERGSNGTQGRIVNGQASAAASSTVTAIRLDDLVFDEGRRPPDLVKMDVEGAEWEVLQAARRLLSEAKPKFFCEVHDPRQMPQLRSCFEGFGYEVSEQRPVHEKYSDYHQVYLWAVAAKRQARS